MSNISMMSASDKIAEAMRRALPLLPADARAVVSNMLTTENLAVITGTLVVWAGSHIVGVGEIVDVILLIAGAAVLGFSVFTGARELYDFASGAINARTDADIDAAAAHFAQAVIILGVSVVQAALMRGAAKTVINRGAPRIKPFIDVGPAPPAGNQLRLARPPTIPSGNSNVFIGGTTDAYGAIAVARDQGLTAQKVALYHELVHRFFSPRVGPLRRFRANLAISGYQRSAFLKYLEEALAQGYGNLKVHGVAQAFASYRFPIANGYVTVSQLQGEGLAVGRIVLGGSTFWVTLTLGAPKAAAGAGR